MITGRWGKPTEVLLDLVVEEDGTVRGVANPGRQNAPIRRGHFDAASGAVNLEGEYARPGGPTVRVSRRRHSRANACLATRLATCVADRCRRGVRHRRSFRDRLLPHPVRFKR